LAIQIVTSNDDITHLCTHPMVVTTGEKCFVTLRDGRTYFATFLDVYAQGQFLNQSQTVQHFPQQTHAEYMAQLQHWTRFRTGGLLIISTRDIIKMESLVHDILAEETKVPIDCLKLVAEYV